METPILKQSIFGADFLNVYEPNADSFVLLDALEKDLNFFRQSPKIFAECGSGSGVIITALSKATDGIFLATDINLKACKTTLKCALHNGVNNIQAINTNFFDAICDRLEGEIDVIIFNPPYVPSEGPIIHNLDLACDGGHRGREVIDKFFDKYLPKLLKKPHGRAYVVAIRQNNIEEMLNILLPYNIKGKIVLSRKDGCEFIHVLRYEFERSIDIGAS